jgi:hypothetical protein
MTNATSQDLYPLTYLQTLWVTQYAPDMFRSMHMASAIRCKGLVDRELLRRSVEWVASRHDVLRSVVETDERGVLWFRVSDRPEIEFHDLLLDGRDVREVAEEFKVRPFDLGSGPLFRFGVVRVNDNEAICVLVIHHIIADGWSLGVFWFELLRHYNRKGTAETVRREGALPAAQYTHIMRRQKEWLLSPEATRARDYWKRRLATCCEPVALPSRRSRLTDAMLPPVGGCLAAEECADLGKVAKLAGIPFSSAILAAFAMLLASWGSGKDVLAWIYHAGRLRQDSMKTIGCFMDMWLLSVPIDAEMSLADAMCAVHAAVVESLPVRQLPAIEIARILSAALGDIRPMAVINFLPTRAAREAIPTDGNGLAAESMEVATPERYMRALSSKALLLTVRWDQSVLDWKFVFDPEVFEDAAIEQAALLFSEILGRMAALGKTPSSARDSAFSAAALENQQPMN